MKLASLAFLAAAGLVLVGCADSNPEEPVAHSVLARFEIWDGTHQVLASIKAGQYETKGPRPGVGSCHWSRLNGTGSQEEIISTGAVHGPTAITILPSDKVFKTELCQPWVLIDEKP